MKHNIGIMQGRLTMPKGRGIQFFPFDNWENEFYIARELNLDEIEFIFDYEDYEKNPLWTKEGIEKIRSLSQETGIKINAVCFDYFMRRPFYKFTTNQSEEVRRENTHILCKVLDGMKELGISLIEIPLVDNSSMQSDSEKEMFKEWLIPIVQKYDWCKFGLETDLNPQDFIKYLKFIDLKQVGANYDSGNSSGLGYNLYEEVTTLKDYIFNIHIKDRVFQGTTVQLGTGSADFDALFKGLKEIGYEHNFILQAARGSEGEEKENINRQMLFVKENIEKYNI